MARTMLDESKLLDRYWKEVVHTIMYTLNRVHIIKGMIKTPYELWFGNSSSIKYLKIFGIKCYIKIDDDIGKFDTRSDEGIFFGYSLKNKDIQIF